MLQKGTFRQNVTVCHLILLVESEKKRKKSKTKQNEKEEHNLRG